MLKYSLKRFLQSLLTLFIIVTVVFILMRQMPIEGFLGEGFDKLDPLQQEAILRSMGLTDNIFIQLKNFYINLLKGDLGVSTIFRPRVPVMEVIGPKVPYSLKFGMGSLAISLIAGLGLGILMARSKGAGAAGGLHKKGTGTWQKLMALLKTNYWDKIGTVYIVLINAVPAAVYYLLIQINVTSWLNLPILYREGRPASYILPLVSMALPSIAGYAMWMRRYMVDELNKDYISLARIKGLKSSAIMVKHVMRNAFIPMAQYLPASILFTISGSLYIEYLYSIPGMGGLLVQTIQRQDTPLVQVLVLIYASFSVFGLFLGDMLMVILDPRIKLDRKGESR